MNLFNIRTANRIKALKENSPNSFLLVELVSFKLFLFVLLTPCFLSAQSPGIIPLPNAYVKADGKFELNSNTIIGMNDAALLPQANYLQTEFQKSSGMAIAVDQDETKAL